MQSHYTKLFPATLAASLVLVALAGVAVAGPYEDGVAAYFRGDYPTALRLIRPFADQGMAAAQNNVGFMYYSGQGVSQDYDEAMKWYRLAAEQGNAAAQANLGFMYYNGHGVSQDYAEAAKWFSLAAEQGYALAQNNLGSLFIMGRGVPKDFVQAHMWLGLSATQGNQDATENLERVERNMTPAQIAEAQKLARNWKPRR